MAVARAMLKTIYAMLTKQEAFRPIPKRTADQRRGVMARPNRSLRVMRGSNQGLPALLIQSAIALTTSASRPR